MHFAFSLFFIIILSSCSIFQDIDYARHLADNGFEEKSEAILRSLSADGYDEAQLALADLYSRSGDPHKLVLAGAYYRQARGYSQKANYHYVRWLMRMSHINNSYREPARRALLTRQKMYHDALPLLARFYIFHQTAYPETVLASLIGNMMSDSDAYGEEVADFLNRLDNPVYFKNYIDQVCNPAGNPGAGPICLQLHFKLAMAANDNDKIEQLITKLEKKYVASSDNLSPEAEKLLYECASILLSTRYGPPHVASGLRIAAKGYSQSDRLFLLMARQEYRQKFFLSDDELLAGLERLSGQGNPEAERILGRMYATGKRVIDDPVRAEALLLHIKDDPRASLSLGRLYLSGKLGANKLQAGVDCLLYSARHGINNAYYELARAFDGWPGIRPNTTYSWIFARMAGLNLQKPANRSLDELIQRMEKKLSDPADASRQFEYELSRFHAVQTMTSMKTGK